VYLSVVFCVVHYFDLFACVRVSECAVCEHVFDWLKIVSFLYFMAIRRDACVQYG
jgi:hypothetical protein